MRHHAVRPCRIGGAGAGDAGDFLGQRAGAGGVGAGGVKVVKRGRGRAQPGHGGGKARLMRGIVAGQQQVGFGQVLRMDKGIRPRQPVADRLRRVGMLRPSAPMAWDDAASHASPAARGPRG
jgi:hypothetical protein